MRSSLPPVYAAIVFFGGLLLAPMPWNARYGDPKLWATGPLPLPRQFATRSFLDSRPGQFQDTGYASTRVPPPLLDPRTLKSWLLFDADTGYVLGSHEGDLPIPPASLTKLVTIACVMDYLQKQNIPLDRRVKVPPEAWAVSAPPRSSLMFLGPEVDPRWQDLLLGLAVSSGNDAALAVALGVGQDLQDFVARMNLLVQDLGLPHTRFVEPSGYSEMNTTTAWDFCRFILWYLHAWPQNQKDLHQTRQFTWPDAPGVEGITQYNRNRLLKSYPGLTGLKTGFIDESGYNFAFSASRDGRNLAGIVLGAQSEDLRDEDARALLDWGFSTWTKLDLHLEWQPELRVFGTDWPLLGVQPCQVRLDLPTAIAKDLRLEPVFPQWLMGPWPRDRRVGLWRIWYGQELLGQVPMYGRGSDLPANPIQMLGEKILLWALYLGQADQPLDFASLLPGE